MQDNQNSINHIYKVLDKIITNIHQENQSLREVIKCFPEYIEHEEWDAFSLKCPYCDEYEINGHKEKCIRQVIPSKRKSANLGSNIDGSLLPNINVLK